MATRQFTVMEPSTRELEIPDYYGDDSSIRGKIVNSLMNGNQIRIDRVRDGIYSDNYEIVKNSMATLEMYYTMVDSMYEILEQFSALNSDVDITVPIYK